MIMFEASLFEGCFPDIYILYCFFKFVWCSWDSSNNTPWKIWDEWEGYLFIANWKKGDCTGEVGKGNWQDPQPQVHSPGDKMELKTWNYFKQVSDLLKLFMLADKWHFQSSTAFQKQFDLLKDWNPSYSINTPFSDIAQSKIKFHVSQIISNSELTVL